jgi:predicted nucleotidyltransferase component of viral defense system
MNPAIGSMLERYKCETRLDYENALKEIIQEVALLGLWRAKFFEHAAFYGGTALRILYGLDRFSEDLDFSLLVSRSDFELAPYLVAIGAELNGMDFNVEMSEKSKSIETSVESAFIKAGTREHLLKIEVPAEISERIASNDRLKIKLEVDTDPPSGFETEAKVLLQPIAFSVNSYRQPDLFAGKIHAVLQRAWSSGRIKGRDYYDFVWYVGRNIPVRLSHLEQRLRQTGGWTAAEKLTAADLRHLLEEKFSALDFDLAKKDILPFIKNASAVELWSKEFFLSLLPRLKTI